MAGPFEALETDADSAPFWEGLAAGRLVVSRCRACGRQLFPPIGTCSRCGSASVVSEEAAGEGTVYSWATVHMPLASDFVEQVPYTVVVVELDEGARVFGRLLGEDAAGLCAGASVRFEPAVIGGRPVPGFRLAGAP
jgi:hypothetical protein